jgi:hypothetical protein
MNGSASALVSSAGWLRDERTSMRAMGRVRLAPVGHTHVRLSS